MDFEVVLQNLIKEFQSKNSSLILEIIMILLVRRI